MNKALTTKKDMSLQEMVDNETENRDILTKFITNHMVRGTDYGSIAIGGRPSKDCLFKSGAEKFASLMRLRADVVKDGDTWEMAGSKPGLFCYRANLYNQNGEIVGMGLGACDVTEKKSMNNAIKIAKKRAFVDAILTTGALSDFFTQDLEDTQSVQPEKSAYQTARENPQVYKEPVKPKEVPMITSEQQVEIRRLMIKKGVDMPYLEGVITAGNWNGHSKTKLEELTQQEAASLIIGKNTKLPDKTQAEKKEEDIDLDQVEAGINQMRLPN